MFKMTYGGNAMDISIGSAKTVYIKASNIVLMCYGGQ